jgi:DNA-directed RNA polymerase subunit M/transcription elongation factor TFIIS
MDVLRAIRAFFRRAPQQSTPEPSQVHWHAYSPSQCPQCGSPEYTQILTDWIIGYKVKNNGQTTFVKHCTKCGYEWRA